MATELTELAYIAAENIRRERADGAIQTDLDSWADRAEYDERVAQAVTEIDPSEPRKWVDTVSFGQNAVIGFLVRKFDSDERVIFS